MDEGTGSGSEQMQINEMSFEQALVALEEIVTQLERGDVPLDKSIELYERGERLRAACQDRLDTAQARIEKIVAGADGKPAGTAPLDGDN
ncbi:exodeoxyribonuclease VII small subunit [Erythrobacter sp. KY5]|uniref:exodeoxyribonuclease VII small subunit n=1 Tax=Erythrobacter sp. KY5 TaxID=2011159 RepID=UPI000DBEF93F|nr:exodeoxyribonuclease VII small subunit [Erythrobacter sp. KY5]AWW74649.1 exodeoxyribonuclease VII small subunit [Erythrobacter sp. KY5]